MLFVLSAPQKELGLQSFSLGICRLPGEDLTATTVITWVTAVNANWIEWEHELQSCQYFSRNIAASAHTAHAFLKVRGLWTYQAHTRGRGCCHWFPLACEL